MSSPLAATAQDEPPRDDEARRADLAPSARLEALGSEARETIASAPVPALLFPAPFTRGTRAFRGDRWLALHSEADDVTVNLHATSQVHQALGPNESLPAPEHEVRGFPARASMNEAIAAVSWLEGDVAYALEVECGTAGRDPRCADPSYALSLAGSLEAAGVSTEAP